MDRNVRVSFKLDLPLQSLSARRAWIEIRYVDRVAVNHKVSLSARRAWIEINLGALVIAVVVSRSPQGERG